MSMDSRQPGHPVFAWTYDALTRGAERSLIGPERRRLVDACRGRVLEVGAGTGASFPYWRDALRSGAVRSLAAVEPDPWMRLRAERRAAGLHLAVDLRPEPAEALPFPDGSFDSVAVFLALCTVADPARALAEARRVLRPGGTLAFLEHGLAAGRGAAAWQRRLRRIWAVLAAGCQLDREPERAVGAAGFTDLAVAARPLPFPLYRLVGGTARRVD